MSKILPLAVVALSLVLVVLLSLERGEPEPPSFAGGPPSPSFATSAEDGPATVGGVDDRSAASDAASPRDQATSAALLLVTVLAHGSGEPVPDVLVRVETSGHGPRAWAESRADSEGRARFAFDDAVTLRRVRVPPAADRVQAEEWLWEELAPGDLLETAIQVRRGGTLVGRVVDDAGGPLANAEVLGWCGSSNEGEAHRQTRTAADGTFELPHLGPQFVALARADGWTCEKGLRGKLDADTRPTGLEIRMGPPGQLSGVVLSPERHPVAEAEVWVAHGLHESSSLDATPTPDISRFSAGEVFTSSDADGRFVLEGLPVGIVALHVKREPFHVHHEAHEVDGPPVEVVLDAGLTLSGRVFEASSEPAAGALVGFGPFWSNVHTTSSTFACDAQGRFELRGMVALGRADCPQHVYVVHEGHAVELVQPVHPGPEGAAVEIRLRREKTLEGSVVDEAGRPVPGVRIWIEGEREFDPGYSHDRRSTWEWGAGLDETRTGAQGEFRFTNLYEGRFVVHVVSPDDDRSTIDLQVKAGARDVQLVLDRAALRKVALAGSVRDAATNDPVVEFTIVPTIDGRGRHHSFAEANGTFELSGLEAGVIEVEVSAPRYATYRLPAREYALGEHRLDVRLRPARTLNLKVVDPSGEPHRSGQVFVTDSEGELLMLQATENSRSQMLYLYGETLTLGGLPDGRVTVHATVGLAHESLELDLDLVGDDVVELVVAPPKPGSVSVILVLAGEGTDPHRLRSEAARALAEEGVTWFRDRLANGDFALPSNKLSLTATVGEQTVATATVEPLPSGWFSCKTRVSWEESADHSSEQTSPDPIIFVDLPEGKVTFHVEGPGVRPETTPLAVVAGSESVVLIPLRRE